MAYEFTIWDEAEWDSLHCLADWYDYAQALVDALNGAYTEDDPYPLVYNVTEPDAWAVQAAVEAEGGYLTCMGGRLKQELEGFLAKIV